MLLAAGSPGDKVLFVCSSSWEDPGLCDGEYRESDQCFRGGCTPLSMRSGYSIPQEQQQGHYVLRKVRIPSPLCSQHLLFPILSSAIRPFPFSPIFHLPASSFIASADLGVGGEGKVLENHCSHVQQGKQQQWVGSLPPRLVLGLAGSTWGD